METNPRTGRPVWAGGETFAEFERRLAEFEAAPPARKRAAAVAPAETAAPAVDADD